MTADQAIGLYVFLFGFLTPLWFLILAAAHGDIKPSTVLRWLRVSLVLVSGVSISDAQGQANAQSQDITTRRIERLEDQSRGLEGLTRQLNEFSQNQAKRTDEMIQANTDAIVEMKTLVVRYDERIARLETGLIQIEAVNSTIKWIGGLLMLVMAVSSGVVAWRQQQIRPHWANGPLDELVKTQGQILEALGNIPKPRTPRSRKGKR